MQFAFLNVPRDYKCEKRELVIVPKFRKGGKSPRYYW